MNVWVDYTERNDSSIRHCFCDDCHPLVFAEASHEKYPDLFLPTVPLKPEMHDWQPASEMAKHFGLRSGKSFSHHVAMSQDATVMGREIEVMEPEWKGRPKLYRVVS